MQTGQIRKAISGFYYIYSEGKTFQTRGRGLFRKQKITPLVGDKVLFESQNMDEGVLQEIMPRKNELKRPTIANVDLAILVMSAVEPTFSTQLLNRYLTILESLHVDCVIYISKMDLLTPEQTDEIKEFQRIYEDIGYKMLLVRPETREETLNELQDLFNEKLVVFIGQSGVGKSTLLNKLSPELLLKTAEISSALGRGKHTTRHVELYPLAGGLVADTPGFSSIEFEDIEKEELPDLFPEFRRLSYECKFNGCYHRHEPGCAVKDALEAGTVEQFRYTDYLQFLTEIEDRKPIYRKKN